MMRPDLIQREPPMPGSRVLSRSCVTLLHRCRLRFAAAACGGRRSQPSRGAGAAVPAPPDVAAPPAGSLKTTSGLSTLVLQPGSGHSAPSPVGPRDGPLLGLDDRRQDVRQLGREAAQPATFAVNEVIPGWTEGLQMMVEGEKRRFWIPESLAYQGQAGSAAGHAGL